MLSKLFHYEIPGNDNQANSSLIIPALKEELQRDFHNVNISICTPGGTLGLFFYAQIDGVERFIKTHLPGKMYQDNLRKEIDILNVLYHDRLYIDRRELFVDQCSYTILIMDKLNKLDRMPNIAEIQLMIHEFNEQLDCTDSRIKPLISGMHSFSQIYETGIDALEMLNQTGFLSYSVVSECQRHLKFLESVSEQATTICHGDLSNKNIMLLGNSPIVIDWEDCFIGIKDYDFCYWLTFFDQRKYYTHDLFQAGTGESKKKVALMILITIIKCYMSYKNGSYKSNSMTFDQRLQEILALAS